jgi:hypothetical protein
MTLLYLIHHLADKGLMITAITYLLRDSTEGWHDRTNIYFYEICVPFDVGFDEQLDQ